MKICVINGSPKGQQSNTLYRILYLQKCFPSIEWQVLNVAAKIKYYQSHINEVINCINNTDLTIFCYPIYTFIAPYPVHKLIELLRDNDFNANGKYVTQITTSKHFYDVTAHNFIKQNTIDMGFSFINGLSEDMEAFTTEKGRQQLVEYFKMVRFSMENGIYSKGSFVKRTTDEKCYIPKLDKVEKSKNGKISIVTNVADEDTNLQAMIEDFQNGCHYETKVFNIEKIRIDGGCLGCFHCVNTSHCIYKDGFENVLRDEIQQADAIVYAFTIKDHSMGSSFKKYDDRQFVNGHRTVMMKHPIGYIINGNYDDENNLKMIIEGRSQVGENYLPVIANDNYSMSLMIKDLEYAIENNYNPPVNFYGEGGSRIFRDLIYVMGGFMQEDYKFYKAKGLFENLPNKQMKTIVSMKLVGWLMNNKKLMKKVGNKINEGMISPYKKALETAKSLEEE